MILNELTLVYSYNYCVYLVLVPMRRNLIILYLLHANHLFVSLDDVLLLRKEYSFIELIRESNQPLGIIFSGKFNHWSS